MSNTTKLTIAIAVPLLFLLAIFLGSIHKSRPYFHEIPLYSTRSWTPEPFAPAGSGNGWELKRLSEGEPAYTHDIDHWVLFRDGKAFDLHNVADTWGSNAMSWNFELIGDKLYVFDAQEYVPHGWTHFDVAPRTRLQKLLGLGEIGGWRVIPPPFGAQAPEAGASAVYRWDHHQLTYVRAMRNDEDAFDFLTTGDYYIAPPGAGIVDVFDLSKPVKAQ